MSSKPLNAGHSIEFWFEEPTFVRYLVHVGAEPSYDAPKVIDTYKDWHLVPESRPVINPAEPKIRTVEVIGRDGVYDFSTFGTNRLMYQNRTGELTFYVENGHDDWMRLLNKITSALHGRILYMVLTDEPLYFYKGRILVSSWDSPSDGTYSSVTLSYDLEPYKYSIYTTYDLYLYGNKWIWDPFIFPDQYIPTDASGVADYFIYYMPQPDTEYFHYIPEKYFGVYQASPLIGIIVLSGAPNDETLLRIENNEMHITSDYKYDTLSGFILKSSSPEFFSSNEKYMVNVSDNRINVASSKAHIKVLLNHRFARI